MKPLNERAEAVKRSARRRGIVATCVAPISLIGVVISLPVWRDVMHGGFQLAIALGVTGLFALTASSSFAIARQGGQIQARLESDRLLAMACLFFGVPLSTVAFGAIQRGIAGGWVYLLCVVLITTVLGFLQLRNWKAPSVGGPLMRER